MVSISQLEAQLQDFDGKHTDSLRHIAETLSPDGSTIDYRWHYQEWAYLRPGDSVEARVARLQSGVAKERFRSRSLRFPMGSYRGRLVEHDMDNRPELFP